MWSRLRHAYLRRASRYLSRRPFAIKTDVPIISFTFDDFPRSALHTGGAILKQFGITGTYYAAFGLMGKQAATGTMFVPADLNTVFENGHELGCHTFDHCHSLNTDTEVFESSVIRNEQALQAKFPKASLRTLAYPISEPRARTKRRIGPRFLCCRGGGQTFNAGVADLNNLSAYFLEKSTNDPSAVKEMINRNRAAKGWLVFATHDVDESHTRWGCSPKFFEDIVEYSVNSGALILPVGKALETLAHEI